MLSIRTYWQFPAEGSFPTHNTPVLANYYGEPAEAAEIMTWNAVEGRWIATDGEHMRTPDFWCVLPDSPERP